ncbi:MAG: hypothetical protein HEP71_01050 [Roseivirga sp.]|nr:hypothetical protein [Roseivirga sp.]
MIRFLKKAILYTFAFLLLLTVTGYIYLYVLPKGPKVTEVSPIAHGEDYFVMYAYKDSQRKSIKVRTYKPEQWSNGQKIVFVMHGGGRNAKDYLRAWTRMADEHNLLIIAPEFASKFSDITTNDYQEGNLFTFFGTRNPREEWAYTVVENVFDHIKSANDISNEHYDIFGHSAGGQFVHRMLMLLPEARIETAVAANAGFYTFPDESLKFPYGLRHSGTESESQMQQAYQKKLIILLGELDNDPELGIFRTTEMAMQQGAHRLERGSRFYKANRDLVAKNKWIFNWEIDTVANVGHDYRKMSQNAITWLK